MKKIFTFILSLVMVLSMSTVTFADTPIYEDTEGIPLGKIYKLANDDTNNPNPAESPAETFKINIASVSVTDSLYTDKDMPGFDPNGYTFTFDKGEATYVGDKNTVDLKGENDTTVIEIDGNSAIALPEYNEVGIFTYEITEEEGETAGVTYDDRTLYLKVTVVRDNDGQLKRQAIVYFETEDGRDKEDSITNTYSAGSLNIKKVVDGNMGETERYFAIGVTLTAPEGLNVNSTISISETSYRKVNTEDGTVETNPTSITVGTPTTFYLKHGETITLGNIPYGVTYTVAEDTIYNTDKKYDYKEAKYEVNGEEVTTGSVEDSIKGPSETVKITNTKEKPVDMGILVDNLPYIIILAGVVVGMGVFFVKKRTANNN